jgi:hypothetical protein
MDSTPIHYPLLQDCPSPCLEGDFGSIKTHPPIYIFPNGKGDTKQ